MRRTFLRIFQNFPSYQGLKKVSSLLKYLLWILCYSVIAEGRVSQPEMRSGSREYSFYVRKGSGVGGISNTILGVYKMLRHIASEDVTLFFFLLYWWLYDVYSTYDGTVCNR